MAGIYIHIPFCKQACHYCDFHFSTSLKYKDDMLKAINREILLQKNFLQNEKIETIYFGGGTPSLLTSDEINKITEQIQRYYIADELVEVTLETNPDDLSSQKIAALKHTPVNRFSIGIQSFFNEDLKWMNRAHQAKEAEFAIKASQDAGFENLTVDLIYGYPLLTKEKWDLNINQVLAMDIPHVSCYSMTVEPKTALASFIKKGIDKNMDDTKSAEQFLHLSAKLQENGFEHYEISNFAKGNKYSVHNTNYWRGVKYLGIGPSAHSFDGKDRQWNIANNALYMQSLGKDNIPAEKEFLSPKDRVNEYIMTALRTMWGLDLNKINSDFPVFKAEISKNMNQFFEKDWIEEKDNHIILTTKGKLYADHIAAELFIEDGF
ncbi:oxygen-independent coproporphyrinogen III oxidase [Pseudopedobacter saltans DSM 12145]|uniref:Heme chaperone HemW n=1 Tax=Pseudopedobacter saltans (strain ATCC 51119 / DSM 12145 / JCM 21818 / CCUG 39354 / LMG 10337 / NBRC 100064 / NCIMB 13643) TaxID=762903 RepID=F0S4Q3_PSESL|nr:radical SAM family heme chaperone HemW [Pseudopedobacter saltans]ADY53071.1 oxygen-independent coproporphyrinogen III oxidase [Pseudopedobacter saltans DSM 12145]